MPWLQLHIATDTETAARIDAALSDAGAVAVTLSDAGDEPLLQQTNEALGLWSQTRVTGLFEAPSDIAAVIDQVAEAIGHRPAFDVETVGDEDWTRSWMERFRPMHFGGQLWVVPSWLQPPDPHAANILLDPGLAFGSGTHASTALCLEWLARHPPTGKRVIDYGCGSGILAIAALKLGATSALGIDNDHQAISVSVENALQNGVEQRYKASLPESVGDDECADLVLANILAQPLITLAPNLIRRTKLGGTLVLAGLLAEQAEWVSAAYGDCFHLETETREGWARLNGTRFR